MALAFEAEKRFRQVVDGCRDAFVEVDRDCLVTEWSQQAETVLGWTREEMVGRSVFDVLEEDSADVIEQGMAVFRSVAASGHPDGVATTFPPVSMGMRHRDGAIVQAYSTMMVTVVGEDFRLGGFFRVANEKEASPGRDASVDRLHDPLTGLPSRALFTRRLGVAIGELGARPGSVAVAVFDLDRFKAINDTMGHEIGDEVLVAVVTRLRLVGGGVRLLLSRLGGDEFLALFEHPGADAEAVAEEFAERALCALDEPFDIGGREIFLTASVGIAAATDSGVEASVLLSNADVAMHESKAAGGRGKRVFGEAMRRQVVKRMTTEHSLHRAIDRRELMLYYQPVVGVSDVTAIGVEALIRWQHPEEGLMVPDQFIPAAEESGLIIPIGAWVLEEACSQLHLWRRHGNSTPSGIMEVNLSARQIDHPGIAASVETILETTALPPENLTLEITESALMRDASSALQVLRALKDIGVALAIDDFGTGYSSLGYLQRFPLDILKVDKTFVDDLNHDQGTEIVAAVINLAHALGLRVVAEGVETDRQLEVLRELGCDYAQGYLFSRPVPALELAGAFSLGSV